ncbi:Spindle and kinetochore-associated protein 2 [Heracleum sosnowskyi]|uniref:Protein FAM33A n=1 Tax=Heracleum sosnowskyi TaxID=360622 RepID=A0AAD8MBB3_9APIA|nr:Spindle and kinetochore-associated protein 2 [Heracleum sosnowskyi]
MNHEAVDNLLNLFTIANRDLNVVENRLEKEFQKIYPQNANPMELVSRIKKIEDELVFLKQECGHLLAAKQDLIDKARTTLVGNRLSIQRLQASTGVPVTSDSDDPAYNNFNQIFHVAFIMSRLEEEALNGLYLDLLSHCPLLI